MGIGPSLLSSWRRITGWRDIIYRACVFLIFQRFRVTIFNEFPVLGRIVRCFSVTDSPLIQPLHRRLAGVQTAPRVRQLTGPFSVLAYCSSAGYSFHHPRLKQRIKQIIFIDDHRHQQLPQAPIRRFHHHPGTLILHPQHSLRITERLQ